MVSTSPTQDVTLINNESNTMNANNGIISTHLLSELPMRSDTLLFGLNFKYTEVVKKGFINRFKGDKVTLDIDISCLLFDDNIQLVDTVWFKQLRDKSEAIRHQGDSLNGKDRSALSELDRSVDVETIELRLARLPQNIAHIALLVSCYTGYPLRSVERGNLYLSDNEGNEVYTSDLTTLTSDSSARCVAVLSRELGEWRLTIKDFDLNKSEMTEMVKLVSRELVRIHGGYV